MSYEANGRHADICRRRVRCPSPAVVNLPETCGAGSERGAAGRSCRGVGRGRPAVAEVFWGAHSQAASAACKASFSQDAGAHGPARFGDGEALGGGPGGPRRRAPCGFDDTPVAPPRSR